MDSLLNYDTSPLVPVLKIIAPIIFLVVLAMYVAARKYYSEKIQDILDILILFAFFTVVASGLRVFGDGTEFGFTKEYSLRWFQSLAYLVSAGCFILAGYRLMHLFEEKKP